MAGNPGEVSDIPVPARSPEESEEQPRLVETAPPPPPAAPAPPRPATVATSQPQPVSMPSPRYPAQALRSGEQGTVMVSAEIDANGVPSDVGVAKSSGSRLLDRAAVDAVRHWRFRPAMADGQPAPGRVQVPISFKN
jgi:protein TonB